MCIRDRHRSSRPPSVPPERGSVRRRRRFPDLRSAPRANSASIVPGQTACDTLIYNTGKGDDARSVPPARHGVAHGIPNGLRHGTSKFPQCAIAFPIYFIIFVFLKRMAVRPLCWRHSARTHQAVALYGPCAAVGPAPGSVGPQPGNEPPAPVCCGAAFRLPCGELKYGEIRSPRTSHPVQRDYLCGEDSHRKKPLIHIL